MLSFVSGAAGAVIIAIMVIGIFLRNQIPAEKMFPESKPRWLIFSAWLMTTFAFLAWIAFSGDRQAIGLLAAAMTTLAAAKFIFLLWAYPHFFEVLRMFWKDSRAVAAVMVSTGVVGALMIYVSRLV